MIVFRKKVPKISNKKQSWKKKVGENYCFETQGASFEILSTLSAGNTNSISGIQLIIKILERDIDDKTYRK